MPPAGSQSAKQYRMNPHLQLQCGPMLRYDTVDQKGIYHAFALIVVSDTGSDYSQTPYLTYRYTPQLQHRRGGGVDNSNSNGNGSGHANGMPRQEIVSKNTAQKLWIYHSLAGSNSFWRMKFEIQLGDTEMPVKYSVNGGRELTFYVPGRHQNMRWVGHSCNGFSAGEFKFDQLFIVICQTGLITSSVVVFACLQEWTQNLSMVS